MPEVEILSNADSVIDLTGNKGSDVVDLTGQNNNGTNANLSSEPEGKKEEVVTEEGTQEPAKEEEKTEETKPEGEEEKVELFFGGQAVDVAVPDEIGAALAEVGIEPKALLAELFAKDGAFELSADTRAKLEGKYGKLMVDGYLNMYKSQNQQALDKFKSEGEAKAASEKAVQEEYVALVGGEEGLKGIESFILGNFDEKQIATYNAVMAGDSWDAQKMILGLVKSQMAAADHQANGDKTIKLVGDGDPASNASGDITDKGFLTSGEYQKLMDSDKYWTDRDYQRKVDAMRAQSIKAGR